jgi:hypothetical protein
MNVFWVAGGKETQSQSGTLSYPRGSLRASDKFSRSRDELSVLPAVLVLLSPRTPLDFLHEFHFLARSPSCGLALSPTGGSQTAESRQFSVVRPRPRESDANPVGER